MEYDKRRGSPWYCGYIDRYYGREANPHYWTGIPHQSEYVYDSEMTAEEIEAYKAGYSTE